MLVSQQDWSARWALYSPGKIALREHESGRTLTYGELDRLGNRLARWLRRLGIHKGDRVAVLAENCLEYLMLFAAAQKTGCILTPINYRLSGAEVDYLLRDAQPRVLIAEEKYADLLASVPSHADVAHRGTMESLRTWCEPSTPNDDDAPFPAETLQENDPVFILYTSGTTGFPKGALYTHKMLFWNSVNTALALVVNGDSRTVNCMPPFHTGGWNVLLTPFLHHGAYVCLMKKFDAAAALRLLEQERATIFMGVPTMLKMLAEEPVFAGADFSSLLYILVGGEPMPVPLIEKWHAKGVAIRQGYGMTEAGPNLTSLHQNDAIRKIGSIGRPNFYVDIKIVDEQGQDTPPNKPGELLIRGPIVSPGYWRGDTRGANIDTRGWMRTGDVVRQDEEGYLYVVDRIKNMFISGGENVYPTEVERALLSHPAVAEAAVVGIPHERWGEVGRAFVVVNSGERVSEQALIAYCKTRLANYKTPRSIVFVEELPKNDTGKIDRRRLKETA
jgi:fatty-acyl-CoA synthase